MPRVPRNPPSPPAICEQCGAAFKPGWGKPGRFCSRSCKDLGQRQAGKPGYGPPPGTRIGSWTVIGYSHTHDRRRIFFNCRCDCGLEKPVSLETLRGGSSTRCIQCARADRGRHKASRSNDGKSSPEYKAWQSMRQRCSNPHNASYEGYGGRGISVCERWQVFEQFLADLGKRPGPGYSLDRLDSNGNYEPGNVRWADSVTQANNKRTTPLYEYQGERLTLAEWARRIDMHPHTLRKRIAGGQSMEQALTQPLKHEGYNRKKKSDVS